MQPPQPTAPSTPSRTRLQTRSIILEGYRRDDGLWDIEARLTDRKDQDFRSESGFWPMGKEMHDMQVRVTIDKRFNIVEACTDFLAAPYSTCAAIAPDYGKIVGLNLMRGFRREVARLFGGIKGCSHVTELLSVLPTAAIQSVSGEVCDEETEGAKPFQLDGCHALETSGEAVRLYFPRWHRASDSGGQAVPHIPSSSTSPTSKEEA